MQINIEPIMGVMFGIDYVNDVPTPDPNVSVDLIRISLFVVNIYIALDR